MSNEPGPTRGLSDPPRAAGVAVVPPQVPRPAGPDRVVGPRLTAFEAGPRDAATVAAFWAEVDAVGTPLVEERPGDPGHATLTFLWRGGDEVAAVLVVANKLADASTYEACRLRRVPGTDVWHLGWRLPADWRGSYALAVVPSDPAGAATVTGPAAELLALRRERALSATPEDLRPAVARWFSALAHSRPDPRAADRLDGDWSIASGPAAPALRWPYRADPTVAAGAVQVDDVALGGHEARRLWLHVPAVPPPPDGWPVLVLLDGDRWADAPVAPVLDALVAAGAVPPLVTVGVPSGDLAARVRDLGCAPGFVDALADDVLGWVAARCPVTADPGRTIVAGQSLGGLTALFAAHHRPDRFGAVIAQSGSFWWPNPLGGDGAEWLTGAIADADRRIPSVALEVGTDEWVLVGPTRRLRAALADRVDHLTYREFSGGHDPACWRQSLPEAVVAVTGAWAPPTGPEGSGPRR